MPATISPKRSTRRPRAEARPRRRGFPRPDSRRLGLVCAGGGITGAIYEIGALAAVEDRLENASLTDFDVFVGVSAGSYLSALIANGISPSVLFRNVTRSAKTRSDIDDLELFRLNLPEIGSRLASAPLTILDAVWDYYKNRRETTLTDVVSSLGQLLPSGLFENEGLGRWMSNWLEQPGRTNDFRKLAKTLRIVAVALDTGQATTFGRSPNDVVPISKAVRASCAIPGLYRPVAIDGVEYVDGGVRKTAHISIALHERCGLVLCANPIVPIRYKHPEHVLPIGNGHGGPLTSRGLPTVLDQVLRVTLHSRMEYGLDRYERESPADILVLEPKPEDLPRYMTQHIMRSSGRARIAHYAYRFTMQTLDADFERYRRMFARHGLALREPVADGEYALEGTRSGPGLEATDTPTRLAAALKVLERDLEKAGAARRR